MTLPKPIRLCLFVLGCAVVLGLCIVPEELLPQVPLTDKIEHALAFATLAVLGVWTYPNRWLRVALGLVALGAVIEILQAVMPYGRDGDVMDAVADTIGVALGTWAELMLLRWAARR